MGSHGNTLAKLPSTYLFSLHGIVLILFLLPAVALSQSSTRGQQPQGIRFTAGAISAQGKGNFNRLHQRVRYAVKAKSGDHMIVNIIPVTKGLTMAGTVKSPSGQGDGGPGGIILNADLTESGDYIIEVFQHTMGSNFASGSFILEVVITPPWLKS